MLKAAGAGAIGGLAGTLAMNYVQRLWTLAADGKPPESAADHHDARDWQERTEHRNSNEMAAQAFARVVLRRHLTGRELSVAAAVIHFSFGAAVGAFYGMLTESKMVRRRSGVAFGSALWLAADEIAMPVMGLSDPTWCRPLEMHLQSWSAHLVYGVVAEQVRRGIRQRAPHATMTKERGTGADH